MFPVLLPKFFLNSFMCVFQVNDFILISDSAYTREQILSMEKGILNRLEWNLTVPTVYMFLVRFLKAACLGNKVEKEVSKFRHPGLLEIHQLSCAFVSLHFSGLVKCRWRIWSSSLLNWR